MAKLPKEVDINGDMMKNIVNAITQNPTWLMRLPHIVHVLADLRQKSVKGDLAVFDGEKSAVHGHAIPHNTSQLIANAASVRPLSLILPLTSISEVWRNVSNLKTLCIGPRSEAEIFHMLGYGWHPDNLKAIDLISYSDYVETGDMHALPYRDNEFDIVMMGWVLAYSSDNVKAAAEAMRVLKPGGYCAVGCVREAPNPETELAASQVVGGLPVTSDDPNGGTKTVSRYYNMGQLKRLFEPYMGHVFFDNDPIEKYDNTQDNVILVFRKKLDAVDRSSERTPSSPGGYPRIRNIWDPA